MKPWTTSEEAALRILAHLGVRACAAALERSAKSIERKAARLGVSLAVTEHGISGGKAGAALAQRIRARIDAPLCPGCGRRPVGVSSTGLCGPCHYEQLVSLKREALEVEVARRRLGVIRQRRRRLRLCERCARPFYPRPESTAALCRECS